MRHNAACVAGMAEQVDARDSKSRAERRAGSIPAPGTNQIQADSSNTKKNEQSANRINSLYSYLIVFFRLLLLHPQEP